MGDNSGRSYGKTLTKIDNDSQITSFLQTVDLNAYRNKYNYHHISANGAQKLSACIYNFSRRIYMTNRRQLPSCQIITLYTTRTQWDWAVS